MGILPEVVAAQRYLEDHTFRVAVVKHRGKGYPSEVLAVRCRCKGYSWRHCGAIPPQEPVLSLGMYPLGLGGASPPTLLKGLIDLEALAGQ